MSLNDRLVEAACLLPAQESQFLPALSCTLTRQQPFDLLVGGPGLHMET